MVLQNPEWLLLLPGLALVGWYFPTLGIYKPLRSVILLLLALILAEPKGRAPQRGMDLYVLLDRSDSAEGQADTGFAEWRKILESQRSPHDELIFVDYAKDTWRQDANGGGTYTGSRKLTKTALALRSLILQHDKDRPSRFLAFTDGYSTEPLTGISEHLIRANIPLDYRLLSLPSAEDYRITRLASPVTAQRGEAFLLEVSIAGPASAAVPLTIYRNGQQIADTTVTLQRGRGSARFTDRLSTTGSWKYEAQITPTHDPLSGNNRAQSWVQIIGGPRLLYVTAYPDDPLVPILQRQFTVEAVTNPATLHIGQLTGCRAVFLNNIPAWELPQAFLSSLTFFVKDQGGGFIMAGGRKSLGAGGYFKSAVEDILPVSMELKNDQLRLQSAMSLVLDRSGSMSAPAGSGTKMDLANEGAARTIELLSTSDKVGVFAVDSEAHEFVPMQKISDAKNRAYISSQARRIVSEGGGIFVYNGLKAAWRTLEPITVGVRHIILFADAADAEEPGAYKELLEQVTKAGATCSVIAMGSPTDCDAAFLKDVALRGKGRIFFSERAEDIPNIFTAETLIVARNSFIKDPTAVTSTGLWKEIAPQPLAWLPELDGYNLSYLKPGASQALTSKDEYAGPLVAWQRHGMGRSMAICFPLGGEYSARARGWPGLADFISTSARWAMGQDIPPGLGLRWDITGTALDLDLHYDSALWETTISQTPPRIALVTGPTPDATTRREIPWDRIGPGHYRAGRDLEAGEMIRGAIQVGPHALTFGPLAASSDAEWAFDQDRIAELRQCSVESGGRELLDLSDAWLSPPLREWTSLRRWLLPALLTLILAEALITRMGWRLPQWRRIKTPRTPTPQPTPHTKATTSTAPVSPPSPEPAPSVASPDSVTAQADRFARAKRR